MNSPSFQSAWRISRIADVLTNYVWLHWIHLGLVWDVLAVMAVSGNACWEGRACSIAGRYGSSWARCPARMSDARHGASIP